MANKHIGPNDKDVAEQHVASIGALQVDLQSWASNSVCLKIDRLKGMYSGALPSIKMARYYVSKPVFFHSLSENWRSALKGFQVRSTIPLLFSLTGIVRTNLPTGPDGVLHPVCQIPFRDRPMPVVPLHANQLSRSQRFRDNTARHARDGRGFCG